MMMMMIIHHRCSLTVAVLLLGFLSDFVISERSVDAVSGLQQQQPAPTQAALIKNTTTAINSTTATVAATAAATTKTLTASTTKAAAATTKTATKTTTINTFNDNNKNKNASNEISIKSDVAADDTNSTHATSLKKFEDAGPSGSITPTTYRPPRPSIAPHTSAQERERKLMNVLAARRTALHRGSYRTRFGTTGRTASTAHVETTPKTPSDPRSICIRNCTKNFTRRTTASCMRQCASFQRAANGTALVIKASSKSGRGTQQRERDTNEILFTDESSHGLFVVAKELNDTANHITEGSAKASGGGYKFRGRIKPGAAPPPSSSIAPTSLEEDDIAPYLYFGQKLPPIRPALLSITSVSDEHPKLLEVSAVATTSATISSSSTLSAVERSRSRYKYNMRDRINLPFNRRFAAVQSSPRQPAITVGSANSGPTKWGGTTANKTTMATTTTTMATTTTTTTESVESVVEREDEISVRMVELERREELKERVPTREILNVSAEQMDPGSSTPLIITVLNDDVDGVTEISQMLKFSTDISTTTPTTATMSTTTTTKRPSKLQSAMLSSRLTTTTPTTMSTTRNTTNTEPTTSATAAATTRKPSPAISSPSPTTPPPPKTSLPPPTVPSSPPIPATSTTTPPTPTSTNSSPHTKSIIEEDTERLRALGPTLTQEIVTDEKTNLIIFVNKTSGIYNPNNNNHRHIDFSNPEQPTQSSSTFRPTTDPSSTILHTTVLTSVRSTVHPRGSPVIALGSFDGASRGVKAFSSSPPTSVLSTDISSTIVTDEREVSMEMRRINVATYVLLGIGVFPLIAVIVYLTRNFIMRRSRKSDEVFDVCIADQQPISPVKKLDSKYRHHDEDEDDEDDVDHHHQQQLQKHHHQHHTKHPTPRDANYNLNALSNNNNNNSNNNGGRYDEQCSVTSDQEFDRSNIRLKSLLGEGNFGQVWKAEADDLSGHFGATRIVAVKTVRACSAQVGLKEEVNIMRKLGSHQNVVTLLGACVESEPHMLIMEYAMRGRLLSLLRAARSATNILPASVPGGRSLAPLSPRTLAGFALDIACGMEYIAERRIVHRDLAARNVLLDHNGVCKICDFGMSIDLDAERQAKTLQRKQHLKEDEAAKNCANQIMRSNSHKFKLDFAGRFILPHWGNSLISNTNSSTKNHSSQQQHTQHHQQQQQQQQHKEFNEKRSPRHAPHDTISRRPALPIRWMAPEALLYHIFTTETDIWAFGIVLWEIATLGSTPYSHLTGREVIRSVPNGLRPDLPKEGRHEFYNLMSRCWHKEAHLRPSFTQARLEISRSLGKWVEDDSANSDYMDVSGFSEDLEHGMVYFNHRISEFECEI